MDIDLVSVTEAMQIMNLSKSQVLWLCNNGRLDAKKVGNTWVIARASAEYYKPSPRGFAVVWQRRRDEAKKFNDEIKAAIKDATQQKQN